MMKLLVTASLIVSLCFGTPKDAPKYNGDLEFYIADLQSSYPCSPYFDTETTWFDADLETDTYRTIRDMLNGLSDAGFNAIRLPLWPESKKVKGEVVQSTIGGQADPWTVKQCDDMSKTILAVLRNHTLSKPNENLVDYFDDKYHYFEVIWGPAFDSRQYQETLSEFEYASWLMDHIFEGFSIPTEAAFREAEKEGGSGKSICSTDKLRTVHGSSKKRPILRHREMKYLSPFSANPSTLALNTEQSGTNSDRETLFEMEVLQIMSSYMDRYVKCHKGQTKNPPCQNITTYKEYIQYLRDDFDSSCKEVDVTFKSNGRPQAACLDAGYEEPENPISPESGEPPLPVLISKNIRQKDWVYPDTFYCVPQPQEWKTELPKLIGPDRATILHNTNVLKTFDGSSNTRPNYLKNIDIIGVQSKSYDITSTSDGYKNLNKIIDGDKDLWLTMSGQEWTRQSPQKESENYQWEIPQRLLREPRKLQQSISKSNTNQYWRDYLDFPPATTPAPIALEAGVKALTVWSAIPRIINSAGDPQFDVDWHLYDRIVDTNSYAKTFESVTQMQNRNWTTPFQVREKITERRYEKPCPEDTKKGKNSYLLAGYDTCVMKFPQSEIDDYIKAKNKKGGEKITSVPLYIDHRRTIYSWVETCKFTGDATIGWLDNECRWEEMVIGSARQARGFNKKGDQNTYLFESNVPFDAGFTVRFGD